MRKLILATVAFALFATAASAETTTTYQPVAANWRHTGYSETQIDYNRHRVTFRGNTGASRDSVEMNMLYRAAELTLASGYDYFVIVDHNVDAVEETHVVGPVGPRWGVRQYETDIRFVSTSDVIMRHGQRPDDPNAFDARGIQARLAPRIERPN